MNVKQRVKTEMGPHAMTFEIYSSFGFLATFWLLIKTFNFGGGCCFVLGFFFLFCF